MPAPFASTIPSPLAGGAPLQLRHWLPRVFTQSADSGCREFAIYWSERDGIGRLHPQPTSAELARFYDTASYAAYMSESAGGNRADAAGTGAAPARLPLLSRLLARIAWQLDRGKELTPAALHARLATTPARVCDLGCGAGALLLGLARLGHQVLGVDPNEVALANGARVGLQVLRGTAEQLPAELPRAAFDMVIMSHSLEHCPDPLLAMRNAASLLAPGGQLVCEVPNHGCAGFAVTGPAWFHTDAGRHLWFFTRQSLQTLARAAGLRPEACEFDGFTRQFGWLPAEQGVWDALYGDGARGPVPPPRRPSAWTHLRVLGRALLGAERRYDAVRRIARQS
jgi:SAM-dependent methyltransferase